MASIQFNFTQLKNVYMEALSSYESQLLFDSLMQKYFG